MGIYGDECGSSWNCQGNRIKSMVIKTRPSNRHKGIKSHSVLIILKVHIHIFGFLEVSTQLDWYIVFSGKHFINESCGPYRSCNGIAAQRCRSCCPSSIPEWATEEHPNVAASCVAWSIGSAVTLLHFEVWPADWANVGCYACFNHVDSVFFPVLNWYMSTIQVE